MDYGAIIKRAWTITWRFKALWVLGLFAGVSGCQGSAGSSGSGWDAQSGDFDKFSRSIGADWTSADFARLMADIAPALIALSLLFIALALVWAVFSVAARGALIVGVSDAEAGRPLGLGRLWRAGFARFWPLVGLSVLLNLPLLLMALVIGGIIAVPIMAAVLSNSEGAMAAAMAPLCGGLVIGVPLMIVASVVLGIMYLIAQRYLVLGGQGPVEAAGNSWRFLTARKRDTILLYLINAALNLAAGLVVAIPLVIASIGLGLPLVFAATSSNWGLVAGLGGLLAAIFALVSLAYAAGWGTFTSALWTLFFRDLTGLSAPPVWAPPMPAAPSPAPYADPVDV